MVATLQSFLAWAMSEDEDRQGISVVCSSDCVNETDGAVELVSSGSASNKLSFSTFVCCVTSVAESWLVV